MSLTTADYERILTAGLIGVEAHGIITHGNGFISAIKSFPRHEGLWADDLGAMGTALERDFLKFLSEIERNSIGIIVAKMHQRAQIRIEQETGKIILFALADIYSKLGSSLGKDRLNKLIEEAADKVGMANEVVVK